MAPKIRSHAGVLLTSNGLLCCSTVGEFLAVIVGLGAIILEPVLCDVGRVVIGQKSKSTTGAVELNAALVFLQIIQY